MMLAAPYHQGQGKNPFPGLLTLSSPGGQKALEPLCQPRRGRGIRKGVAAQKTPQKKDKQPETRERERDRGKQRASGQPNPETRERPHNSGARPQKKPLATRWPQRTQGRFYSAETKRRNDLREKAAPKNKRKKTCPPRGQKTNRVLWGNLTLILACPEKRTEEKEKKRAPPPLRTNNSDKADFLKGNKSLTASFGLGYDQTALDSTKPNRFRRGDGPHGTPL